MSFKETLSESDIFRTEGSVEQMRVVLDEIQKLAILTDQDWYLKNHNGVVDGNRSWFLGGAAFSAAIALAIYGHKKFKDRKKH